MTTHSDLKLKSHLSVFSETLIVLSSQRSHLSHEARRLGDEMLISNIIGIREPILQIEDALDGIAEYLGKLG